MDNEAVDPFRGLGRVNKYGRYQAYAISFFMSSKTAEITAVNTHFCEVARWEI